MADSFVSLFLRQFEWSAGARAIGSPVRGRVDTVGQTVARGIGPEGLLVGLSYAPWLHD